MSGPDRDLTSARREFAAAMGVLTLATVCCFHKLVVHPGELLVGPQKHGHNDLVDYFLPAREFAAQSIRGGQWPFWNSHICLGLPYTGNPQSALYYPPNWLTLFWAPQVSLSWLLVAHHLFAGIGVYCLSRRYGLCWSAGVLGGVVFLGAPFLIAQAAEGHYPQICAVAWIPWAFLAYERFRDARAGVMDDGATAVGSIGTVVLMASSLAACFFCGHAQETYYLVVLLTGCLLDDAFACCRSGDRRGAVRLCTGWAQCGLYTVGLAAIDLAPIYLATLRTARPGLQHHAAGFGWTGMTFSSWRELFDPFALTRPELWEPGTTPFWEKLFYFGVCPLVLAVIGAATGGRRSAARRMTVLWFATVAFAFGAKGDVYQVLARALPGMAWFREPSRILFFTSFATALLSACGWHVLLRFFNVRRRSMRVHGLLCMVGLAATVGELTWFADQVTDTATVQTLEQRNPELASLLTDAAPAHRVLAPQPAVSDRDAVRLRVPKVSGYEPAGPVAYLMVSTRLQGTLPQLPDPMGFLPADPLRMDRRWLELLGVRYAVRPAAKDRELPNGWRFVDTYRLPPAVRRRGDSQEPAVQSWDVLELEGTLPRASVVGHAVQITQFAEFAAQLPNLDPHRTVALDTDVRLEGSPTRSTSARILAETPTRVSVESQADVPGYLVMSDLWSPGWTATVGGKDAAVLRANGAFRAVALPAGTHTVEFTYRPRGFVIGVLVTTITMLGLAWKVGCRLMTGTWVSATFRHVARRKASTLTLLQD